MRVPVQPIGCPSAMAPPLTFRRSTDRSAGRAARRAPAARRLRSAPPDRSRRARAGAIEQLADCRHGPDAHAGADRRRRWPSPGSARADAGACSRRRPSTGQDHGGAAVGDARRGAGRDDAGHARRPASKTGGSFFSASIVVAARGCSSAAIDRAAFRPGHGDGRDLGVKRPARDCARRPCCWLSSAKASDCLARDAVLAREQLRRLSHHQPGERSSVKPSRYIASTSGKLPILWPHRASTASMQVGHAAHRLDAAREHDVGFAELQSPARPRRRPPGPTRTPCSSSSRARDRQGRRGDRPVARGSVRSQPAARGRSKTSSISRRRAPRARSRRARRPRPAPPDARRQALRHSGRSASALQRR